MLWKPQEYSLEGDANFLVILMKVGFYFELQSRLSFLCDSGPYFFCLAKRRGKKLGYRNSASSFYLSATAGVAAELTSISPHFNQSSPSAAQAEGAISELIVNVKYC